MLLKVNTNTLVLTVPLYSSEPILTSAEVLPWTVDSPGGAASGKSGQKYDTICHEKTRKASRIQCRAAYTAGMVARYCSRPSVVLQALQGRLQCRDDQTAAQSVMPTCYHNCGPRMLLGRRYFTKFFCVLLLLRNPNI